VCADSCELMWGALNIIVHIYCHAQASVHLTRPVMLQTKPCPYGISPS
jgi:hypothetical protein